MRHINLGRTVFFTTKDPNAWLGIWWESDSYNFIATITVFKVQLGVEHIFKHSHDRPKRRYGWHLWADL